MKTQLIIFMSLAGVILLTSGCDGTQNKNTSVLTTIGGKKVTSRQFSDYLRFKRINPGSEEQRKQIREKYLERSRLAAAVEKTDKLDQGLLDAELDEFRKEMLISRYFDKFLRETVTEDAVKNYYVAHQKDYTKRKVKVAHILIRASSKMSDEERQAKLTTAQEAYSRLKSGEKFEDVAREMSEDKISAKKGGQLGWMQEGSIAPAFSSKIFSMKAGEVSEPFSTPYGFHIVKILEGPMEVKQPYKAVKGDIRYLLRNKAKDAELKRLMSQEN